MCYIFNISPKPQFFPCSANFRIFPHNCYAKTNSSLKMQYCSIKKKTLFADGYLYHHMCINCKNRLKKKYVHPCSSLLFIILARTTRRNRLLMEGLRNTTED